MGVSLDCVAPAYTVCHPISKLETQLCGIVGRELFGMGYKT